MISEGPRSGLSAKCQVPCPKAEIVSPEGRVTEGSTVAVMAPAGALDFPVGAVGTERANRGWRSGGYLGSDGASRTVCDPPARAGIHTPRCGLSPEVDPHGLSSRPEAQVRTCSGRARFSNGGPRHEYDRLVRRS